MREANSSGWPFEKVSSDGFDMDAIFGGKKSNEKDLFEDAVAEGVEERAEVVSNDPAPATVEQKPAVQKIRQAAAKKEDKELNPIEAAYQQTAAENAQQGLFEKLPVFCYRTAKEPIQDADMTFEELRIRKSEDFTDLEEGKYVSWSVEYCGIRKDVKNPKGTKISAMEETIERFKEFMEVDLSECPYDDEKRYIVHWQRSVLSVISGVPVEGRLRPYVQIRCIECKLQS